MNNGWQFSANVPAIVSNFCKRFKKQAMEYYSLFTRRLPAPHSSLQDDHLVFCLWIVDFLHHKFCSLSPHFLKRRLHGRDSRRNDGRQFGTRKTCNKDIFRNPLTQSTKPVLSTYSQGVSKREYGIKIYLILKSATYRV